jgi:hypothetical protein
MKRWRVALAITGLALLTFFQFPGHTWLQQDTQIYTPILEHLRDPSLLRNDMVAQHPHVAFTLYDEAARALRSATGLGFREVLQAQQLITRALGIWGLYLMAEALGLSFVQALAVAAICSLGAAIAGPAVLTFEYEPTPRAFAVPLLWCGMGLSMRGRYLAAGIAGAAAFLYHPPTALPFCAIFAVLVVVRRQWRAMAPLSAAAAILLLASRGGDTVWLARLTPLDEQLQRLRASYVWISTWPTARIWHHLLLFAIVLAALWRVRGKAALEARLWWVGLPLLGILSMPLSWLLLERMKWSLAPQIQPLRTLLFVALAVQFLSAVAAFRARHRAEAFGWFAAAFLLPLIPVLTDPWSRRGALVAAALASGCALWDRARLPVAVAAFFAVPIIGGVVHYPHLHTPELAQLSDWARLSTAKDAVFLFPDAGRGLQPGIFRAEALRAVYVDWKAGGQVNYLRDFGEDWWFRWQQTMAPKFSPMALPRFGALGVQYVVLQPKNRMPRPAVFENAAYVVYRINQATPSEARSSDPHAPRVEPADTPPMPPPH